MKGSVEKDWKIVSEEEWRRRLRPEQYRVLRESGTERSGSGAYLHESRTGTYACAGCGLPLFSSTTKYDACGWPSFWDALPGAVDARSDTGAVEAICARCEGHLGHIFADGPPPTGKRY
ncbi:MAG: peptide-methionine (R)-S-oxide reductase [Planctomycetes bacterium]|nr:peptide-methionine (R)-S-oxide reductase [Planctomycetota bacterium]